ncbi:hypothetical protein BD309DRAFT_470557 [Dichomitus squalens]|nr:hypothetical protein BD309DRAFT_470557 [Dichomitus squalens]
MNEIGDEFRSDERSKLGVGWHQYTHPEGKVYFRYKNVYTDAWLLDKNTLNTLEAAVAMLCRRLRRVRQDTDGPLLDNIEIGIHLTSQDSDKSGLKGWFRRDKGDPVVKGCYHLCDMTKKEVFWLDEVPAEIFWEDLDHNVVGRQHLHIAAEAAYWEHIYIFPHDRTISQTELHDLREKLAFWTFDAGSSKASTSPYTATELKDFSRIVGNIIADSKRPEDACIVGKLKGALLKIRFAYFFGEEHAQINNSRGVFPHHHDPEHHSYWFRFLNCLSFYTAASYYVNLNHLWIGRKMSTSRWNDFVIQLQDDWYDAITPATVILAANLSFLAISSVDDSGLPPAQRSLGQIVSYISLILNVGNIAASTILARQHRSGHHSSFEGEPPKGGPRKKQLQELERLAVIFSIPATFFWWGLLTFFISIAWICFNRTAQPTRYTAVVTIVLSMFLLLLVILYTYRDNHRSIWAELSALLPLPGFLTCSTSQKRSSSQDPQDQSNNGSTHKGELQTLDTHLDLPV